MTNLSCLIAIAALLLPLADMATAADRPNILWITCEDMGPHIGPCGDTYATTPNLDEFAKSALRYKTCWSNAPVCAPARTTLITGMYATTLGAEHMRSEVRLPNDVRLFPHYLRDAGYYCTNNAKEDYNVIKPGQVWDESSRQAHWKNRPAGKPFFAVFNIEVTHESQIQKRRPLTHDPAKVRLPAYQPDLPAIREDWAQYYDNITRMDELFGQRLKELEDAGLAEDTIVWFFSDHGAGLPRNKRCAQNSGLHVPLLIRIPEKFRSLRPEDYTPGGVTERLVSFVDFGPTVLSLAGRQPDPSMQGVPFLGEFTGPPRKYLIGYRSRMDERIDLVRCVRDEQFVYVRNYLSHKPQGQHVAYMFLQAGTRAWKEAFNTGTLTDEQAAFFEPKPAEALYDLQSDPDEIRNLAKSPSAAEILPRFREQLAADIDLGLFPESELRALDGGRSVNLAESLPTPEQNQSLRAAAESASRLDLPLPLPEETNGPVGSALTWWHTIGLMLRGENAVREQEQTLLDRLKHLSPAVRIAAAEALVKHGSPIHKIPALEELARLSSAEDHGLYVAVEALNVIDALGKDAAPIADRLSAELPEAIPQKLRSYIPRLVEDIRSPD